MPTARPESAGRRGPIARHPVRTPTGYRIDDRTRFELQVAAPFAGCDSKLQSILDLAIAEFLDRIRGEKGFEDALRNAEEAQRRREGTP
jgi:hypothetical protein